MRRLSYAETQVLTTDEVAETVMAYARTLALVGASDVVQVPAIDRGGTIRSVELLIGPSSQILSMTVDDPDQPIEGSEDAVRELDRRIQSRLPSLSSVVTDTPQDHPRAADLPIRDDVTGSEGRIDRGLGGEDD